MSNSKFNPVGNLEIWKVYKDGTREIHWGDHNVITSGMGVGLSYLFTLSGSNTISDFQITHFQVGTGGDSTDYGASTYALNTPLDGIEEYGPYSELVLDEFGPLENGVVASAKTFPQIRFSNIHKVSKNSVRYTLVLDTDTANNVTDELDEIGLFMKNPLGSLSPAPILVAYRPFTSIKKTDAFSLVFLWTLQF